MTTSQTEETTMQTLPARPRHVSNFAAERALRALELGRPVDPAAIAPILAMREHEHADELENSHLEGYAESEKDRDADIKKLEARIEELETEKDALELTIRDLEGEITERDACSASTAPGTIPRHRFVRAYRAIGLAFARARNETTASGTRWSKKTTQDLLSRLRFAASDELDAILRESETDKPAPESIAA
jgi:hypothetical protein